MKTLSLEEVEAELHSLVGEIALLNLEREALLDQKKRLEVYRRTLMLAGTEEVLP